MINRVSRLHNEMAALFARGLIIALMLFSTSACAIVEYQRDRDVDGVANKFDRCPDTDPETVVGKDGCSLFNGEIAGVEFETDELELTENSRRSLDELVTGLLANPAIVIAVNAHTDNRGKASKNLQLSKQRVMAVVEYLVNKGISHQRLKPYAYGESRPVVSNATAKGRTVNRRIEVEMLDG